MELLQPPRFERFLSTTLLLCLTSICFGQNRKPFNVNDDIALSQFGDLDSGRAKAITFSPNRRFFVVDAQRGRLDINRAESTLRIYRTEDVRQALSKADIKSDVTPIWAFSMSTYKDAPIIWDIRWLRDSSAIAFLAKTISGRNRLFVADLRSRNVSALTSYNESVTGFDIRDRNHFVYTVASPLISEQIERQAHSSEVVVTGESLWNLLFPELRENHHSLSELWAFTNGNRWRVVNRSGKPVILHPDPLGAFSEVAMAPNGQSVVTTRPVAVVPPEWEHLYPPPFPADSFRLRAGRQDLNAFDGMNYISEYVTIDLHSGSVRSLTHTPAGLFAGWNLSEASPAWSDDGRSIILPNTFIQRQFDSPSSALSRPCVAVIDVGNESVNCVLYVSGYTNNGGIEANSRYIYNVSFTPNSRARITIEYSSLNGGNSSAQVTYIRSGEGTWSVDASDPVDTKDAVSVSVRQSLNIPPRLVAVDHERGVSQIIWDPNPQLHKIELSTVSVMTWKDAAGNDWRGGLYEPPNLTAGRKYPLVIQTHGFSDSLFMPDGAFNSGFAAQELAADGIVVLQVSDCTGVLGLPKEAACNLAGYEGAVKKLVAEGLIDPERIGIVGFSRTCYYVLRALTTNALHLRAATITDGVNFGYFQYIMSAGHYNDAIAHDFDAVMGSQPFGSGLQEWLRSSPEFNMEKITTPLQIVGIGPMSLLSQWEPYAALRYLGKPVDIMMVPEGTHNLSNPRARLVSQGGTVDWMRFWLQDYEDPSKGKEQQYLRWREMRRPVSTESR